MEINRGSALRRTGCAVFFAFMLIFALAATAYTGSAATVEQGFASAYEAVGSGAERTVRIDAGNGFSVSSAQELCNLFNTGDTKQEYAGEDPTASISGDVVTLRAGTTIIFYRGDKLSNSVVNAVTIDYLYIASNIVLDGNGGVIRSENLGVDESGFYGEIADNIRLFEFRGRNNAGYFAALKNVTLRGGNIDDWGAAGGGIRTAAPKLVLDNVTVRDCQAYSGGGLSVRGESNAVYAYKSKFIRNIAQFGGGFLAESGSKIYMGNSSCSENRSTRSNGGGGAGEVNGGSKLYLNNCTFSNNISTEYGGAVNVYNGYVYALNSTFTGNVTFRVGLKYGGAFGIHGGGVTLANCLLAYNYAPVSYSDLSLSDIGGTDSLNMYGCVYSGLDGFNGTRTTQRCYTIQSADAFAASSSNRVYHADGSLFSTESVSRPLLVNVGDTSVVPLSEADNAANNGYAAVKTSVSADFSHAAFFDPDAGQWTAIAGVFDDSYTVADAENDVVTLYQDGTVRDGNVVGAYGGEGGAYYSVQSVDTQGVTIKGASYYGETYYAGADRYPEGRDVTVEVVGGEVAAWEISTDGGEQERIEKGASGALYGNVSVSEDAAALTIEKIDANFVVRPILTPKFTVGFVYKTQTFAEQVYYAENRLAKDPNVRSVPGYTFEGWYTDEGFENKYDFNTPVTSSLILYGKDSPNIITFNFSSSKPAAASGDLELTYRNGYGQYLQAGFYEEHELINAVFPTAELKGWTFEGFFTSFGNSGVMLADSEGKIVSNVTGYTDGDGRWITPYTYISLYPRFTAETLKLTLDAGEGQAAVSEVWTSYDGTELYTNEALDTEIAAADIIPTAGERVFTGYFDAPSGGKRIIDAEGKLTSKCDIDGNTALYAQYADGAEAEYTVVYYHQNLEDDGYTEALRQTLTGSGLVTVRPEAVRGENGEYLFNEKKSATSGTISGNGDLVLRIYYDLRIIELTYQYYPEYIESFKGAVLHEYGYSLVQRVKYGSDIVPPTLVTVESIYFIGYSADYQTTVLPEKALQGYYFSMLISFRFPIEYILNGGVNAPDNPVIYVCSLGATILDPTKTGSNFVGWRVNGSDPVNNLTLAENEFYEEITLEAVWQAVPYNVTVIIAEGNEYGQAALVPDTDAYCYSDRVLLELILDAGYEAHIEGAEIDEDGYFTMPAGNVEISIRIVPAEVGYTVRTYLQNADGEGYAASEETGRALTDSVADIEIPAIDGFVFNEEISEVKGSIAGDGSTVFELYFDRRTYRIRWKNGEVTLFTQDVLFGSAPEYGGETPTRTATDLYYYEFVGWTPETAPAAGDTVYAAQFRKLVGTVVSAPVEDNEIEAVVSFDETVAVSGGADVTLVVTRVFEEGKVEVPRRYEALNIFNAKIISEGADISDTVDGNIRIRIAAPPELKGRKNVTVIMNDEEGRAVERKAEIKDGYLVFTTDFLGDFAIAADWEFPPVFFFLLLLLLLIILAVIIFVLMHVFDSSRRI